MATKRVRILIGLLCAAFTLCTPYQNTPKPSYAAKVLYVHHSFSGSSITDLPIIILPVLTQTGFDTTPALSVTQIGKLLVAVRSDLSPRTPQMFESKYRSIHDSLSLAGFYHNLLLGNVLALSNSDSVWRTMDAPYCLVFRIVNALTIHGFNGIVKRRLVLETELWSTDSAEAVIRVQVAASAQGDRITDADFVRSALAAGLAKLPIFEPANNEQNW